MEYSENIQGVEVHIEIKSLIMKTSGLFLKRINKVRFT